MANRRGPGRPKNVIKRTKIPHLGIVDKPYNFDKNPREVHTMELIYENPTMFKKIFTLFNSMLAKEVTVRFESDCIKMVTKDRYEKSTIFVKIKGKRLNHYYCKRDLEIGLSPNDWKDILNTLAKDHTKIELATENRTERSKVAIRLYDEVMDMEDFYNVDVSAVKDDHWAVEEDIKLEKKYPIKFEIPFKVFKRKVKDFKSLSDKMIVEKIGHTPLRLSHTFKSKRGKHATIFKNSGRINLISTVEENDMFFTSVYLDHIYKLSTSLISENIEISAAKENKMVFTCRLDNKDGPGTETCVIKVLTDIIDNRNKL
jgi:hypothetical protein